MLSLVRAFCYNKHFDTEVNTRPRGSQRSRGNSTQGDLESQVHQFRESVTTLPSNELIGSLHRISSALNRKNMRNVMQDHTESDFEEAANRLKLEIQECSTKDLVSLIFVIRKLHSLGIQVFDVDFRTKVNNIALEAINNDEITIPDLVHVFFSMSILQMRIEPISKKLFHAALDNFAVFDSMHIELIIKAINSQNSMSVSSSILLEYITRNYKGFLTEFNIEKRVEIFKSLACCNTELRPPRFIIPRLLRILKDDLKQNLDQMNERSILWIVEAYQQLPRTFPRDLLEEINTMIVMTIQHNSDNIQSSFILQYFDNFSPIHESLLRRFDQGKLKTIMEALAPRLSTDSYLHRNLSRLLKVVDTLTYSSTSYPEFNKALCDYILNSDSAYKAPISYEFLMKRGISTSFIISKLVSNGIEQLIEDGKYESLNHPTIRRIYASLPDTDTDTQKLLETLQHFRRSTNDFNSLHEYSQSLKITSLDEEFSEEFEHFKEQIGDKELVFQDLRRLTHLLKNNNCYRSNRKWVSEKLQNVNAQKIAFLLNSISSRNGYIKSYVNPIMNILSEFPDKVNLSKTLRNITSNDALVGDIFLRTEQLNSRFGNILTAYTKNDDVKFGINEIYSMIALYKKLEMSSIHSGALPSLISSVYKNLQGSNLPSYLDIVVANILLSSGKLNMEVASLLYDKMREGRNYNDIVASKVLAFILRSDRERDPKMEKEAFEKIESMVSDVQQIDSNIALSAVSKILAFPYDIIEEHFDSVSSALKDHITFCTPNQYNNIFESIDHRVVRKNRFLYNNILKCLCDQFKNIGSKIILKQQVSILEKVSLCGFNHPQFLNQIVQNISKQFNILTTDELVNTCVSLSRNKFKQADLLDRIILKLTKNPKISTRKMSYLLAALEKVGHDSSLSKSSFKSLFLQNDFIKYQGNAFFLKIDAVKMIAYALEIGIDDEKEVLAEIAKRTKVDNHENLDSFKTNEHIAWLMNKMYGAESPEICQKIFCSHGEGASLDTTSGMSTLEAYLKIMDIEYERSIQIEGIQIPLRISSNQQKIIGVLDRGTLNFDRYTSSGKGLSFKRCYRKLESLGHSVCLVNMNDFLLSPDHLSRVNYLISVGVETDKTEFDFSSLPGQEIDSQTTSEMSEEDDLEDGKHSSIINRGW